MQSSYKSINLVICIQILMNHNIIQKIRFQIFGIGQVIEIHDYFSGEKR